jgi:hypothetical protein
MFIIHCSIFEREAEKLKITDRQMLENISSDDLEDSQDPTMDSLMTAEMFVSRRGEWGLLNPEKVALDDELRGLCSTFREMAKGKRSKFRKAQTLDQKYTLLAFARRSALFALRDKSPEILRGGLTSIAMVDTDFRYILVALAVLHHSAKRLELDATQEFEKAAQLANSRTAKLFADFVERDAQSQDLSGSWGFEEVVLDWEIGFAKWGFAKYDPETDLLQLANWPSSLPV